MSNEIMWLFPTPIAVYDLSYTITENINNVLQGMSSSNNNLVEGTRGNRDPSTIPELKSLYDEFQYYVNIYSDEIGIERSSIFESWMNILYKNGSVGVHRHYGSIISAAFYPYVEEGSSPIVFVAPTEAYRMMDVPYVSETSSYVYTANIRQIEATTGKLVLFPSWIQHYVPTNKSNIRVTLSFNTKF